MMSIWLSSQIALVVYSSMTLHSLQKSYNADARKRKVAQAIELVYFFAPWICMRSISSVNQAGCQSTGKLSRSHALQAVIWKRGDKGAFRPRTAPEPLEAFPCPRNSFKSRSELLS
jgi:hypothetical protein